MLFSCSCGQEQIDGNKNEGESLANSIAMAMRRYNAGASPDWEVQGFTGIHWMPPSGECLRCVAPAAVMVNEFVEITQNTNKIKTQLLASNYGTFWALVVCENFIPQHRPSTQLIDATNFVKWNVMIGAEELAIISGYQTLSADKK